MRRNPGSHHGTEWLHVAILESKIQREQDPAYFEKHSVLNLDYRVLNIGAKEILISGHQRELIEVLDALQYQLSERLKFIKTADPSSPASFSTSPPSRPAPVRLNPPAASFKWPPYTATLRPASNRSSTNTPRSSVLPNSRVTFMSPAERSPSRHSSFMSSNDAGL